MEHILKNNKKNERVCIHEVIQLMTEMFMNMRNRSHRCNKNRPRSRHGCKYTTYKKCLIMMILTFPKQHQILRLKEM